MNFQLHPIFRDALNSFARAQTAYDREEPEDDLGEADAWEAESQIEEMKALCGKDRD